MCQSGLVSVSQSAQQAVVISDWTGRADARTLTEFSLDGPWCAIERARARRRRRPPRARRAAAARAAAAAAAPCRAICTQLEQARPPPRLRRHLHFPLLGSLYY
jgi:hypothetical protein